MNKIDENEFCNFGDVVSWELAKELKEKIDFMNAFIPLGEVAPIMVGLPGVPEPDPNIFQECDGSEITNPNSPLRSQGGVKHFVPNMIDRYIRMPISFGLSGQPGGENATLALNHNHGGATNTVGVGGAIRPGNKREGRSHYHEINPSFNIPLNVEPPFYTVKFYMRIL